MHIEKIVQGKPAAPGYALAAPVFFSSGIDHAPTRKEFLSEESEIASYLQAVSSLSEYFENQRCEAISSENTLVAQLMDACVEMVSDEDLANDIMDRIRKEHIPALDATCRVFDEILEDMATIEDEYARQRRDDMQSIQKRLLRLLSGLPIGKAPEFPEEGGILVGDDLAPADTVQIPKERLLGIVSRTGGVTSHVAILARNLGIPAVVGADFDNSRCAEAVCVDGFTGQVVFQPGTATRQEYHVKSKAFQEERRKLDILRDLSAVTKDGRKIALLANIGHCDEVDLALKYGAEGIGLFRTEFLFMDVGQPPGEEEQFHAYRKVLEAMGNRPVTVRTFDIGGDKSLPYIKLPHESNPFLGLRGCRLYRDNPELILSQLRALYRASIYGKLRIMFPMVIDFHEVEVFLSWTREAKNQLSLCKNEFDDHAKIGVMVETPAAALIAGELLKIVDFCSLGTNDLTQYTLAVDRGNEHVADFYHARHPAVLRLIRETVQAGKSKGKPVGLCGELAADISALPFFLEIEMESLSMAPISIPTVKKSMREFPVGESRS